jgi:hypothetical protein
VWARTEEVTPRPPARKPKKPKKKKKRLKSTEAEPVLMPDDDGGME